MIEDVVLYVLLAIALGLVRAEHGGVAGLPGLVGLGAGSGPDIAYHVGATIGFFLLFLLLGPRLVRSHPLQARRVRQPDCVRTRVRLRRHGGLHLPRRLGFLGAFVAGIVTSNASEDPSSNRAAIETFSFAFFIPVYFVMIGLRLDLARVP